MDESQKHFRLGLFVVIALLLMFVILFILGGRSLFKPKVIFETYFDNSVSGLAVGSPVQYRGIPLGTVVEIDLSNVIYEPDVPREQRKSYVIVRSELTGSEETIKDWHKNVQLSVQKGLRAQTQLAGITGQQYLSLDYVRTSQVDDLDFNWQPKYTYIPSAPSSTGEIIAGVKKVLASLNDADITMIGQNLNQLIVTLNQKVAAIDTNQISNETIAFLDQANAAVTEVNTLIKQGKVDQTLAHINSASANLDQVLADPKIRQTVASLASVTSSLKTSLANGGDIEKLIKDLDKAVLRADTIMMDNQYDINSIIRDLRVTAENLKDFSESAKQNPSGIIFGGAPEKIKLEDK
ncbi:MlaD family protein [Motilimonas sp. KMU-193]|uniref:MlaD family protein n=1 Tax=Motilimonas sp. KMU-193 TaxID=3388668 RepID=UPI00396B413F